MKGFQKIIMKDLGWKILSLVIATSIWFMVINIEHPMDTRGYTQTLQVQNMSALKERGLTVSNLQELENTKVNFKVKAQRTALDRLSRYKDKIFVFVDLKNTVNARAGDTIPLEAQILLPEEAGVGFEILNRTPVIVEVKTERLIFRQFSVSFSLEGGAEKNTVLGEVQVFPEKVTVSGPESVVKQVVTVKGALPVDNTVEAINRKVKIYPYDKDGTVVKGVSLGAKEVQVVAGMYQAKEIPLKVDFRGVVAEGYGIGDIAMTPQKIMVYGNKTALKNLAVCQLPQVSVENATEDVVQTFDVGKWLPEGVYIVDEGITAKVQIQILEQSKTTLPLPMDKITINGADTTTWEYHFLEEEIQIQCTGPAEVMKNLTAEQIAGSIDVAGLGQGLKKLEVKVNLPAGIIIVGNAPRVSVDIKKLVEDNGSTDIEIE